MILIINYALYCTNLQFDQIYHTSERKGFGSSTCERRLIVFYAMHIQNLMSVKGSIG